MFQQNNKNSMLPLAHQFDKKNPLGSLSNWFEKDKAFSHGKNSYARKGQQGFSGSPIPAPKWQKELQGAAMNALGSAVGSVIPGGGALLGALFNEGGQVGLQKMMQQMPPEVQQLVQGLISGQIPPEQAIQALVQMGIPQEQAVQMVQQVMQMAQQGAAPQGGPAGPLSGAQPLNKGGEVGGEPMVAMVIEETPKSAPVSKIKKKQVRGHNTDEMEISFDTKSFSDPALVPPMSAAAMKALK